MANNIDEREIMPDSTMRFIIKIDNIKQSFGLWYSLLAQKILPFLLYIIPVNVVLGRAIYFVKRQFVPDSNLNGTFLLVIGIIVMIGFLAVMILSPKTATVIEFVFGFGYLFLAFRHHLFTNLLGYSILIGMILFLLVKLVFLMFEIIRLKAFADDKKNNIERDESGRIIRAADEEVFFIKEDMNADNMPKTNDEVFFVKEDMNAGSTPKTDDDFFFVQNEPNLTADDETPVTDNDFFFG